MIPHSSLDGQVKQFAEAGLYHKVVILARLADGKATGQFSCGDSPRS